jgi:hypothetical protein
MRLAHAMHVIHHAHIPSTGDGAGSSTTLAGRDLGLEAFEVALLAMPPGAATAAKIHAGELVVLTLGGAGKLLIDGGQQRFAGPCTLLIPPHRCFEIGNSGTTTLQTIWIYTRLPTPFHGDVDSQG